MLSVYYNAAGQRVDLGKQIGRGGEGAVFVLATRPDQVAKIYTRPPDASKQDKLRLMQSKADPKLLDLTGWPLDTLHTKPGGSVVGFLMPNIGQRSPVHMLYSPAYRRQQFPKAAWNMLLYAARNTAAAFETLHQRGHVIGDVNQDSVMVGADSTVSVIDCDSFQIEANGSIYYCEVGVSHFTPPELQGLSSFRGVRRTPNHDAFGLALLIFHLLFGGRHPYSGVPLQKGVGESLEADIKAFRYAYAADAARRGSAPPPRSIPISLVPAPLRTMFDAAFLEPGALGTRPSAHQWRAAIDYLISHLSRCANTKMHIYPDHLKGCPWCQLETHGIVYFLALDVSVLPGAGFVLARAWVAIEAVAAPRPEPLRDYDKVAVKPTPPPAGVLPHGGLVLVRLIGVAVAIGLALALPRLWFVFAIVAWAVWKGAETPKARNAERQRRQDEFSSAQVAYKNLLAQHRAGSAFADKKQQLSLAREELAGLDQRESRDLEQLKATAKARQRTHFLNGFFIENAKITGVGRAKKATLRSFGIETAADIEWNRVINVNGFGETLTRALTSWKASCERQFVFDPNKAVSPSDVAGVRTAIAARRRALETLLGGGAAELERVAREANARSQFLHQQLTAAGRRLAQARADLTVL